MTGSSNKRAFTLIELLVVIAIIAILAAILFPVFAQAREMARKTTCMSNFKQAGLGIVQYYQDYDERMVPVNSGGNGLPGWGFGHPDYVWPELVQPYVKNWYIFRCPSDPNATDAGLTVDPNGTPVPRTDPQVPYYWGERTDIGINYTFVCPWVYIPPYVGSRGMTLSQIEKPADTILAADSIWDRSAQGYPLGGGNWVIEAPCILDSQGRSIVPVNNFYSYGGWVPGNTGSWLEFGGIWPRHAKQSNVIFCDGHAKSKTIGALTEGCDVRPGHAGAAYDPDKYIWDLR